MGRTLANKPLYSRRQAEELGLRPRQGAKAASMRQWQGGEYAVYFREDLEPAEPVARREPAAIDLLLAVFTVNRTAKRYRDKATEHFGQGECAFARDAGIMRHRMFELKDRGIMEAWRQGRLVILGKVGPLTYYAGEGYRFNSPWSPRRAGVKEYRGAERLFEEKPDGCREACLMDARFVLEALPPVDAEECVRESLALRQRA